MVLGGDDVFVAAAAAAAATRSLCCVILMGDFDVLTVWLLVKPSYPGNREDRWDGGGWGVSYCRRSGALQIHMHNSSKILNARGNTLKKCYPAMQTKI